LTSKAVRTPNFEAKEREGIAVKFTETPLSFSRLMKIRRKVSIEANDAV